MKNIKLKLCGMKNPENIRELTMLSTDYMGFIFWEPSRRFMDSEIPELPGHIKKTGVFVNANIDEIVLKIKEYDLQAVQLHGEESPQFCDELKEKCQTTSSLNEANIEIIKVFSIKDDFDFDILIPYEKTCDFYLFDTKGKLPGGNGYRFNWNVLKGYPSQKPFFLSGGIGLNEIDDVLSFLRRQESKYCYAIDVNSRFEIKPGLKDINKIKTLIKEIN